MYNVTGNRGFPIGATRLAFVFSAEGMENVTYWYTIPEAHRFDGNDRSLKLKFWATSDLHLSGSNYNSDYWPEMTKNRNNAMEDIFASDADLAFINGDVVNYGHSRFPELLTSYLNDRINNDSYNVSKMPVFLTNGNHEYMNNDSSLPSTNGGFDFDPIQGVIMGQLDYIAKNYPDIKITHDGESMWYAADIKGVKFIFLSSPEEKASGGSMTYTVSEGQLEFLDYQLYESEASNKTAVVVTHVPLDKYVPADTDTGYQAGISNTSAVEQILAMHPNTLFCTGHSHSDIGDEDTHFVVTGDMTEKFTHLNDGCLVWIDPTDGVGENGTAYIKSYSTGMYIEIYNDLIVVRGRKFLDESKYFGHAVYLIPTQNRDRDVVKAEISKDFVYGNETFDAVVGDEEEYTYSWIIDGAVVGTEKTLTLTENADYEGKYLYLRATDKDGYYVTTKSAYPYMTVKEIDAGQKCENPKTVFVPLKEDYSGKYVTIAVYDGNDTLCTLKFVTDSTKLLKININPALDAKTVKVMVLDNLSSLVPVCENKTIAVD